MSVTRTHPVVPAELPKLLHDLSYAVIKNNPMDIISFAVDHFQRLYNERERQKEEAETVKEGKGSITIKEENNSIQVKEDMNADLEE